MNIIKSNENTVISIEVAQMVNKEHRFLLRDIRRYINQMNKSNESKIGLVNNKGLDNTKIETTDFFIENYYIDAKGETRPCYNITRKGCEFIANKLTGTKGTEFTARYVNRFHELEEGNLTNSLITVLNSISESMNVMKLEINDRLSKLEETQNTQETQLTLSTYTKPYNPWFKKMSYKYTLLEEYFDVTRGQLYKNILNEMENLYDIDTSQIQADYLYENNLQSCYPLEPYEYSPKYRDMIEHIVNTNLIKYGIASEDDPITSTKHITIFDKPIN